MRINISNSLKITIDGVETTGINLENVTDTAIKNCIFYENGKVQGEAIFDLICENNTRLDSSKPLSLTDKNTKEPKKDSKKINFVFGFWKYTLAYLNSKNYNPYGD
ncbi:TPA: hypothetical protein ACYUOA_000155 [Escherichia coli]|uniref:hypothetical protein n=1 Tax=Escherichia coli TaxID=562 RepID=UPI000B49BADC|nr:hypothetical protein [Escherichia coli]EFB4034242.1 hypothetical protein [Escherichia coli]EFG5480318.1 hypothetical protein [Escherichia coli]EFN9191621.1 hypothetical protein [Escherichia coli]EJA7646578.1 hypothetical protein [Escherichia coli]ELJ6767786.1 hypothetical protein [Escherichia coli]